MKIAILIGVDMYSNSLGNLPACKHDVNLINSILNSTGEFSNILCLSENCTADYVKSKISDFISEIKGNTVDEIFFYFTGHGDFYEQQFYYVLSDFDSSKRKQTSLENTEVDNWLRSLNPNLTIKVVDACHSGTTYIKSESAINEHLEKSTNKFKNCYFMFSSNQNQASYQDSEFSFFTRSFLKSLFKEDGYKIRYKDIIDFVSDEFDRSTGQTPIFITQGTFTEIFCISSTEIKKIISPVLDKPNNDESEEMDKSDIAEPQEITLEKLIQEDVKKYCDKGEVEELMVKLKEHISKIQLLDDIKSIFDLEIKFHSYDGYEKLPKQDVIGRWLNKNQEEYFAEPETEAVAYETEVPDYSTYGIMRGGYRTKTKYRSEISGIKITANLDYDMIKIDAEPKYPNVPTFHCSIVLLVSKTTIVSFYFFSKYREKNWESKKLRHDFKWQYSQKQLKDVDVILESFSKLISDFEIYISQQLFEKFKLKSNLNQS